MNAITEILKIDPVKPQEALVGRAVRVLKNGGVIGYPTETVYGIGCNFFHQEAVDRIYAMKKRRHDKAFILIVADPLQVRDVVAEIPESAERLMENFWPGPLTIIFKSAPHLQRSEFRRSKTIAVRIPDCRICLALLKGCGFPIVSTSANLNQQTPADTAGEVLALFDKKLDLIIDGGRTPGTIPSTIVDVTKTPVKIIRQGAVSKLEINTVLDAV